MSEEWNQIFYGPWIMGVMFFLAAVWYASVGHGGASAYLMVMAWLQMSWQEARPTALALNVVVALIGVWMWRRQQAIPWGMILGLLAASLPAAYGGSQCPMNESIFRSGMALVLFAGAVRLWWSGGVARECHRTMKWWHMFVIGGLVGFFSGWMGIGGGVFLTPVLLLGGYASVSMSAWISAVFILMNSLVGLGAFYQRGGEIPTGSFAMIPFVVVGGLIGSWWGSRRAPSLVLKRLLASMLIVSVVKLLGTHV